MEARELDQPAFPKDGASAHAIVLGGKPFQKAGWWARFLAMIIDFIVTFIINQPFGFVLRKIFDVKPEQFNTLGNMGAKVDPAVGTYFMFSFLFSMLIGYAYLTISYHFYSASPGKLALGLRLYDENGNSVNWWRTILRDYVGKFVSAFFLMIGYFVPLFNKQGKALHDMIGGTVVVKHIPEVPLESEIERPE